MLEKWPLFEKIRHYARIFGPDEDAQDIAQQTWERILRYPVEQQMSFPLAKKIAHNIAVDWLRREKRFPIIENAMTEAIPAPGDAFSSIDLWESLRNVLDQEELKVMILSFQMEMTLQEIAGSLGRPLSTIASIRQGALKKARDSMQEAGD